MFPLLQTPINLLPDSIPSIKEELANVRSLPIDDLISNLMNTAVNFTIDLVVALLVFYIGKLIIKRLYRVVSTIMSRRNLSVHRQQGRPRPRMGILGNIFTTFS